MVTKTLNPLPFEALEPKRFEDLVRLLAYDFKPWRSLEPTGRLGSDDGYDARGMEMVVNPEQAEEEEVPLPNSDRLWQIQCKREKNIGPKAIEDYADEMLKGSKNTLSEGSPTTPYGVIFAAACDFSKKTRDAFAKKMRENGVQEFYLWGKTDLEDKLYQPKNDHLLYAFFGISLMIRKRTMKTKIKSVLAIKRKIENLKFLDAHKEILLRDVNDTYFPYEEKVKDFKKNPPWKRFYFLEHYHSGIVVSVRKFYAYRELDPQTGELMAWGFNKEVDLSKVQNFSNGPNLAYDAWVSYNNTEKSKKAYFETLGIIPYESIIEIDEMGDLSRPLGRPDCPHIFIEKNGESFFKKEIDFLNGENHESLSIRLAKDHVKLKKDYVSMISSNAKAD